MGVHTGYTPPCTSLYGLLIGCIQIGERFAAGNSGQVYHGTFCSEDVVLKECYAEMICERPQP